MKNTQKNTQGMITLLFYLTWLKHYKVIALLFYWGKALGGSKVATVAGKI